MKVEFEDSYQLRTIEVMRRGRSSHRILTDDVDGILLTNGKSANDESRSIEQHIRPC